MSDIIDKLRERIDIHASYVRVFDSPDGERVLRHILRSGYAFNTTFVRGDPQETMLNEGSRRLALSILKFVKRDHKELVSQVEEGIIEP